jgi:hypothetical protein
MSAIHDLRRYRQPRFFLSLVRTIWADSKVVGEKRGRENRIQESEFSESFAVRHSGTNEYRLEAYAMLLYAVARGDWSAG